MAFHQTSNNALRFHRFMDQFVRSVERDGDVGYLETCSVVEAFQRYCYKTYGSYDGVTDRKSKKEGVVRHQPCASHPISLYQNSCSLRALMLSLEAARKSPCNASRYKGLVNDIKREVIDVGELRGQKAIMTLASMELFIGIDFMAFFSTGSTQQLKNLSKVPFCLERQDQVSQLRKHLLVKKPTLLPMQADEYLCNLSAEKRNGVGEVYYRNHSIYWASRSRGSIVVSRLCWDTKQTEMAPKIRFNYNKEGRNHYIPVWACKEPRGDGFVSLCSTVNLENKPKPPGGKWSDPNAMLGVESYQGLLSRGAYVVIKDLSIEVQKYFGL